MHVRPLLLCLSIALLTTVGQVRGQESPDPGAPPNCVCTQTSNTWPASHASIGSATTTAICTVIHPTPSTTSCQVSGTITLNYQPVGFTFNSGSWGLPPTTFPTAPATGITNYTNAGTVVCGQGSVSSYIYITGTVGGNLATLSGQLSWSCDPQ
jgi:hypothetical protein